MTIITFPMFSMPVSPIKLTSIGFFVLRFLFCSSQRIVIDEVVLLIHVVVLVEVTSRDLKDVHDVFVEPVALDLSLLLPVVVVTRHRASGCDDRDNKTHDHNDQGVIRSGF